MKVCPQCKRIYEDAKNVCPHDNTKLQMKAASQAAPNLKPLSHVAQEVEQQRVETQGRVFKVLGFAAAVLLLLFLGGSPWSGVNPPSSETQNAAVVAEDETSSAPVPSEAEDAEPAQAEAKPEKDALVEQPAPPPESEQHAAAEEQAPPPESERPAVEKPASAPEPSEAVESSAPEPEQGAVAKESASPSEPERERAYPAAPIARPPVQKEETRMPAQKVPARESISKPEQEKRVSPPPATRVAGKAKDSDRPARAEERQMQRAPMNPQPQEETRIAARSPKPPMVWIYKTKTVTGLLSKAQAGAPIVRQLKSGEKIRVVGAVGDYFEVRSGGDRASSFYVRPQDVTIVGIEE